MKQTNTNIQSPMEAKLWGFRDCFREIHDLKFASLLLVCTCILFARSSNLHKAADFAAQAGSKVQARSNYVRLLRFFATGIGDLLQRGVLRVVLRLAKQSGQADCLIMDRTEWEHRKQWRNLLVVGLRFQGYLLPLVWVDLAYHGASDVNTRLRLLERLSAWWPKEEVPIRTFPLVADREFIGEDWLVKVAKLGFQFVVRLKSNRHMSVWFNGQWRLKNASLRTLRRYLKQKKQKSLEVVIAGEYVCHLLCLDKIPSSRDAEPYLYLLTNLEAAHQAGTMYAYRYSIECCFKHLKANGFDLEQQGFAQIHQVEILMAVIVLIYAICVTYGNILYLKQVTQQKRSARKTFPNGMTYPSRSFFRTGLTNITAKINPHNPILHLINELLNWISTLYKYKPFIVE